MKIRFMKHKKIIRILYLDGCQEHLSSIQEIFQSHEDMLLLSSSNVNNFKNIISETHPNVVIINAVLKNHRESMEILSSIKNMYLNISCIIFSSRPEFINNALDYGASGFVLNSKMDKLPSAVKIISGGKLYFPGLRSEDLARQKFQQSLKVRDTWLSLTDKEKHIVALKKLGWTPEQMADVIKLSPDAVTNLTQSVLEKTRQPNLDSVVNHYIDLVEELID